MKKLHIYSLLLIAAIGLGAAGTAFGQDGPPPEGRPLQPPPDGQGPPPGGRPGDRGQILRELGLSREQFQQIRRMNQERRPVMDAAHHRLNEANRLLDEAIYADTIDQGEIDSRLKEVQAAQGEVIRLRFANELQVRKILTPEQLVKFREMRENFQERRDQRRQHIPANDQQNLRPNAPGGNQQNLRPNTPVNNQPARPANRQGQRPL